MADFGISQLRTLLSSTISDTTITYDQRALIGQIQSDLNESDPNRRLGGANASPALAAGPAAVVVVPVAAIGISLAAILAILVAITGAILLYLVIDRYGERALKALAAMTQALVQEVAQLRSRVRSFQRENGNMCNSEFETLIRALNTLAARLNSPALSRANSNHVIRVIGELLLAVATALLNFVRCIDPTDSLGLIDRFLRPNGLLMRGIRRILNTL